MLIKYSGHDISSILFLGIYIGHFVAIAAITLDMLFTVGDNVFASAPNMTALLTVYDVTQWNLPYFTFMLILTSL